MSDRLHVSTRKGLFTIDRSSGGGWKLSAPAFLGQPVSMSLVDSRDGCWYAAITHGHFGCHLHRSRDEGKNWEEITAPKFPEGSTVPERMPTEEESASGTEPPTKPASLSEIWALETGGADQTGVLWCGTIPGALFKSPDGGDSWEIVRGLWDTDDRYKWFGGGKDDSGLHSISVDPRDAKHIAVAFSSGGIWQTYDGGASWGPTCAGLRAEYMPPELADDHNAQDPHRLASSPADPDVMWIQHHNGVFKSENGGRQWTELHEVPPSVFGFAVATHPTDRDTAWFVPAQKDEFRVPVDAAVVVTKTTDGGKSFTVHRDGLPQEHAYDIVYRHALDVDQSGDVLAMGSSTGGLWVSDDGGASWETIAANLPPIYAVRLVASGNDN